MVEILQPRDLDWEYLKEELRRAQYCPWAEVIIPDQSKGKAPAKLNVWDIQKRTGEKMSLAVLYMDSDRTFPPHVHYRSCELLLVLSGEGTMKLADTEVVEGLGKQKEIKIKGPIETINLRPDTIVEVPPGRAQAISIPSEEDMVVKTLMFPPYDSSDEHHVDF